MLDVVTNLDWVAADFAVFDVDLTVNRYVENHRNLFPAIGTVKEVLHQKNIVLTQARP
jgi:hypothetical protein